MTLMPINHRVEIEERSRVLLHSSYENIKNDSSNRTNLIPVVASKEIWKDSNLDMLPSISNKGTYGDRNSTLSISNLSPHCCTEWAL